MYLHTFNQKVKMLLCCVIMDILFATKSETSDILASVETLLENISNIEFVDIIHLNLLIASCAQNSACDESKFV